MQRVKDSERIRHAAEKLVTDCKRTGFRDSDFAMLEDLFRQYENAIENEKSAAELQLKRR